MHREKDTPQRQTNSSESGTLGYSIVSICFCAVRGFDQSGNSMPLSPSPASNKIRPIPETKYTACVPRERPPYKIVDRSIKQPTQNQASKIRTPPSPPPPPVRSSPRPRRQIRMRMCKTAYVEDVRVVVEDGARAHVGIELRLGLCVESLVKILSRNRHTSTMRVSDARVNACGTYMHNTRDSCERAMQERGTNTKKEKNLPSKMRRNI